MKKLYITAFLLANTVFSVVAMEEVDQQVLNNELIKAVEKKAIDLEKIKNLLKKGAEVNFKNNRGRTPLYCAVMSNLMGNSIEAIKILIQKGAEIDAKDGFDNTPLHYAASKNMEGIVNILIENGANIHSKNKDNATPLYVAAYNGYPEVMETVFKNMNFEIKRLSHLITQAKRKSLSPDLTDLTEELQVHCVALLEAHKKAIH